MRTNDKNGSQNNEPLLEIGTTAARQVRSQSNPRKTRGKVRGNRTAGLRKGALQGADPAASPQAPPQQRSPQAPPPASHRPRPQQRSPADPARSIPSGHAHSIPQAASPPTPPQAPPSRGTFLAVPAVEPARALAGVGVVVGVTGTSVEARVRVAGRWQGCWGGHAEVGLEHALPGSPTNPDWNQGH